VHAVEPPASAAVAQEEHVAPHARRLRARDVGNRLRESLLFLPLVQLAVACALEEFVAILDRQVAVSATARFGLRPDAAVTLLSTVAGATITTAGVVFSLLVVTLQLASAQFSPRVLRTFWRDRSGQVLIGLLLSTFAFCVLALTQIDTAAERAPVLTIWSSLLLAFASLLAIVAYLNRIARQHYVGRILESVATETTRLIHAQAVPQPVDPPDLTTLGPPIVVRASRDGWVQQLDNPTMVAAVPPASVVRVDTRIGAFLAAGEPIATLWPGQPLTERQVAKITALVRHALIQGDARTMQQDIDFGLRQMTDIALRALSPSVTDPTTAIEAVMWLATVTRRLVQTDLPAHAVRAEGDRILLTPCALDHAEYVAHSFGQLRHYAAGSPQVAMALVRSLRMLRAASMVPSASQALDQQLTLTVQCCEQAGLLPFDLDMIRAVAQAP